MRYIRTHGSSYHWSRAEHVFSLSGKLINKVTPASEYKLLTIATVSHESCDAIPKQTSSTPIFSICGLESSKSVNLNVKDNSKISNELINFIQ